MSRFFPEKYNPHVLILFLCLLVSTGLNAQRFSFKNFTINDGLPVEIVNTIIQDSRGNIWFGTEAGGAVSYDGISFTTYTVDDGLASNYVYKIVEDNNGVMWFGTDNGLTRYDGTEFYTDSQSIRTRIYDLTLDDKGNLWVGTLQGLYRAKDEVMERIMLPQNIDTITAIEPIDSGRVWLGTEKSLMLINDKLEIIKQVEIEDFESKSIRLLWMSSKGYLWVGIRNWYGSNEELLRWDGYDLFNPTPALSTTQFSDLRALTEDSEGNFWIGSNSLGVAKFDGRKWTIMSRENGLVHNQVKTIFEDKEGNIWIGTQGGVSKYSNELFTHYSEKDGVINNDVWNITQASNFDYWIGTQNGVTRIKNSRQTSFASQIESFSAKNGFLDALVFSIVEGKNGEMWFGTEKGLAKYDGKRFTKYTEKDGLIDKFIFDVLYDEKEDILWISTAGGINSYKNGKIISHSVPTADGAIVDASPFQILKGPDKAIWFFSFNTVKKYSNGQFSIINLPKETESIISPYSCALFDKSGVLWLGNIGSGLVKIRDGRATIYTKDDGLVSNNIYLLVNDEMGDLWVGSEKGIERLKFDEGGKINEIKRFGSKEGFLGVENNPRAVTKDVDGNLWFGTSSGVTKLNIDQLKINPNPPQVHITNVRLFYENLEDWSEYSTGLSKWYHLPENLVLPYNQNNVSFDFVGISTTIPEKVKYQYILEGADKKWSPSTYSNLATYTNLKYGTYTFKVLAANESGVWTETPVTFSFRIKSPIWLRWWFILGSSILIVGTVWYILYRRFRAINLKIKLENQLSEMERKALRLQMNPHFIFNALDSISSFIFKNDAKSALKYLNNFAKLMRLTLEASKEHLIPIETEAATLRNYLELEKLRFKNKFDFEIEIDPEIEYDVGIPPMLIQPQVENAILHGVGPKKDGPGIIKIEFIYDEDNDRLICEVTDNGVGRDKAKEIKEAKGTATHKSMATQITKDRIEMLSKAIGKEMRIDFVDLTKEDGSPAGTKVIIDIPVQYL